MTVALERRGARCGDAAVVRGWMRGGCRHRGHRDERGHRVRRIVVRAANYWRRGGLCLGYSLFRLSSQRHNFWLRLEMQLVRGHENQR